MKKFNVLSEEMKSITKSYNFLSHACYRCKILSN